jgi:signal transduction histidine kinase
MNRLVVRLVLSHVAVAVVGVVVAVVVVRALAPGLFDQQVQRAGRGSQGGAGSSRMLREQFAAAVDTSLMAGVVVGALCAAVVGAYAAYRLTRPLTVLGEATRTMAAGHYDVDVPHPGTKELDELAESVRSLGASLGETESRRIRLLGEVAHELRTPLTVVDGYVEGMIDGVLPTDDATLSLISGEVRRLRRLADDLSALSRAEEGRLDLAVRSVDLRQLVREAVERLRPQAEDSDVDLALLLDPDEPVLCEVDPDRIAQVITNLIGNALRATAPGGRVTVSLRADGPRLLVTVADTGAGLASADLERVFERFYRVPGRRRVEAGSGGEGSGIGLTISRRIAAAHGGTLTATSPGPGQGSVFTLVLPAPAGPRIR